MTLGTHVYHTWIYNKACWYHELIPAGSEPFWIWGINRCLLFQLCSATDFTSPSLNTFIGKCSVTLIVSPKCKQYMSFSNLWGTALCPMTTSALHILTPQTLIMFFLWRLWVYWMSIVVQWYSALWIVQDMFLSCHSTYHSAGQGCDVYPASILPYWRHPAHILVKWPFFSPTR